MEIKSSPASPESEVDLVIDLSDLGFLELAKKLDMAVKTISFQNQKIENLVMAAKNVIQKYENLEFTYQSVVHENFRLQAENKILNEKLKLVKSDQEKSNAKLESSRNLAKKCEGLYQVVRDENLKLKKDLKYCEQKLKYVEEEMDRSSRSRSRSRHKSKSPRRKRS